MLSFIIKILTLIFIIGFLPLMIVVFLFLLIHGINPIYKSKRVGRNEKAFTMFKFRSLKPDLVKGYLTSNSDQSFFYFSNFLRNSKLDELPQLINILIGDMNWVGPRANDPRLVSKYSVEDRKKIFSIKPGLTDFSTLIYGIRSDDLINNKDENDYFDKIEKKKIIYRKLYVDNKNCVTDLKIIVYTAMSYMGIIKLTEKNFKFFFK